MPIVSSLLFLILGIIVLVWAGDWLVRGAAAMARHWGVPALIVGLTIVAFGTSAPELVVSIQAVLRGASELASANVIGSNIANVLLALGLPALIMAIPTNMSGVARNSFVCLFATIIFIALAFIQHPLMMWQGAILFAGIIIYLVWMFRLGKSGADDPILAEMTDLDEGEDGLPTSMIVSFIFIIVGIIGLAAGGHLIVENAMQMANLMGVSETLIGLTIVAIGTSLPEIATVMVATWRGQPDVAIGNVLGSNVFNIFAVMGAAALAGPVDIKPQLFVFDMWVMLAATLAMVVFVLTRAPIGKKMGIIFLLGYALYIAALARGVM